MTDRLGTPISRKMRNSRRGRRNVSSAVSVSPWPRAASLLAVPAVCLIASAARADGTIIVSVRDGDKGVPLANATVSIDETSGRELRHTFPTDQNGIATSPTVSDGNYQVTVSAVNFQKSTPVVVALSGNTVRLDIALSPNKITTVDIVTSQNLLHGDDTTISTTRTQTFLKRFPVTEGDRQSMSLALRSVPGFVYDGLSQAHPRGDQNATAIYLDGILLPQTAAGHITQFLTPEAIQSMKVVTGGFSAQYGGQTGAVLDIASRPAYDPDKPPQLAHRGYLEYGLSGGSLGTWDNFLNVGNTVNAVGLNKRNGGSGFQRKLSYSLSLGQHYSDAGAEPPQSGSQSAQNNYASEVAFGNIGLQLTPTLKMSTIFNYSSGRSGVANRNEGVGFLGLNPTGLLLDSDTQSAEDKRSRQKDNEGVAFLKLTQELKNETTLNLAVGYSQSSIAQFEQGNPNPSFAQDTSWEYYGVVGQSYSQSEFQADITSPKGLTAGGERAHLYKVGFVYQDQSGNESYYYDPRSVQAANYLNSILPAGITAGSNVLFINRSGNYSAIYAQDTWRLSSLPIVFNYGLRLDNYQGNNNYVQSSVSKSEISPRLNLAYTVPQHFKLLKFLGAQPTIIRASYDHLFTQPQELGQGLMQGTLGIAPERTDQFDFSIEHQLNLMQIVKLNFYSKDIKSLLGVSQLVPGTQSGPFTSLNMGDATVSGIELQYDYNPSLKPGLAGYFTFSNSNAKPKGGDTDNLGNPVFGLPQDQRSTLDLGLSYIAPTGWYGSMSFYYGSGLYASTDPVWGPILGTSEGKQTITEMNIRLGTGPRFFQKRLGVELGVENLFNGSGRYDLRSPYAGTRYQQSARIRLGVTGKF